MTRLTRFKDRNRDAVGEAGLWDAALGKDAAKDGCKCDGELFTIMETFVKVFRPGPSPVFATKAVWS